MNPAFLAIRSALDRAKESSTKPLNVMVSPLIRTRMLPLVPAADRMSCEIEAKAGVEKVATRAVMAMVLSRVFIVCRPKFSM